MVSPGSRLPVVCGVDIGSTNTKVVALDQSGHLVARASRPTPRSSRDLSINGDAICTTVEELIAETCGHTLQVHAVCVAGVGEDGLLLDSHGQPTTDVLSWFDPRRQEIFAQLRPLLKGDERFDVATDAGRALVGWLWAREQLQGKKANVWVALTDLPAVRWSGRAFLSDTLASRTAAWLSADETWDRDRVEATLGSVELLPPVVAAGEVVGGLSSPLLHSMGTLAASAITVAGGHDHPIAGWAVDQMLPGAVLDSMGTAEVVVAQSATVSHDRRTRVDRAPGIKGSAATLLRVEELARNVQWASREADVGKHIRLLLSGAVAAPPVWDAGWFIRGTPGGGVPRYSRDAPQDPLLRASAVLGALAIAGKEAVDAVSAGLPAGGEVRLAGGWVRSPGWLDIKSAVNEMRTIPILEPEVTAAGAALLAAQARGWEPDPALALEPVPEL